MGINNLLQFLKKKNFNLFRETHFSEFIGCRVAVDTSGLIYKFKILSKDMWLDNFSYLIFALRKYSIHPIFVFEGQAPPEKDDEKCKRNEQRLKTQDKILNFRQALDKYYENNEVSDILTEEMKKFAPPSLGGVIPINIAQLEKRYAQIEGQIISFREDEILLLKKLFDLCGIQHINSPTEAETLCCYLEKTNQVDAVISSDSDILAYGVKKFMYNINAFTSTFDCINFNEVLSTLNFTKEQFLDFCILCGTDYNDNIPNVGPANAYLLISKYTRIEDIQKDISILNHKRVRELFTPKFDVVVKVFSTYPKNMIEIYNFLKMKNSRIKLETISDAFKPPEIIF